MLSLRHRVLSIIGLSLSAAAFAAEVPEPGQIRKVRTVEQPGRHIYSLTFSADGSRLLSSGGRKACLWDARTGKEIASFAHEAQSAWQSALSPDGRTVAACFGDCREILLMDAGSGQIRHCLSHQDSVTRLCFAPDGKTLASAAGLTVRLWEVATGKEMRLMRLRDPVTGKELEPKPLRQNQSQDCVGLAFSPNGQTLTVGVGDGAIRLCDPATGAETGRLFHKDDDRCGVCHLAFSPDGRFLAAGDFYSKVGARLWDVTAGKVVREFRLPPPRPVQRPREEVEMLAAVLQPKALERILQGTPALAYTQALAFSPDGKTLAISGDKTCLWEVATGRVRHQLPVLAHVLAFSPNGFLATAGVPYTSRVDLWDWRDPCRVRPKHVGLNELDQLWTDLAAEDAVGGYRAIAILATVPDQAVEMLTQRLRPIEPVPTAQLDQLVSQLDHESFSVREQAFERLAVLGEAARSALQRALAQHPSPEVQRRVRRLLEMLEGPPSAQQLRYLRAVEVLEYIGTKEATRVLQTLAGGASETVETKDAQAALERLVRR